MSLKFNIEQTKELENSVGVIDDLKTHKTPILKEITEEEALIHEYLILHKKAEELEMKAHLARMEEIKKKLQSIANETADPIMNVVFASELGNLIFSPRAVSSEIKEKEAVLQTLTEKFGPEAAMSCIKIGLTELKKMMSEKELEPFIEKKFGSRTLKAVVLKKE